MAGTIQINEAEYAGASLMCTGCAQNLLSSTPSLPSSSSDAVAMQAFMRKMTELGTIVNTYKAAVMADAADLDAVRQALAAADAASSRYFG